MTHFGAGSSQFWNVAGGIQSWPNISNVHHPLNLQSAENPQRLQQKFFGSKRQINNICQLWNLFQFVQSDESEIKNSNRNLLIKS